MSEDVNVGLGNEQSTESVETVNETQNTTVESTTQDTPITEIELDGIGKVKLDDIKEWKQGYMRQSDYTRKTQELALSKKEQAEAIEVYNYLKNNPDIAQALSQGDFSKASGTPVAKALPSHSSLPELQDLQMKMAGIELDNAITSLKSRYKDFDEVEVLTEADRLGVTDLEFVYLGLQGKKLPEIKKQIQAELTKQIKQNGIATETLISDTDKATPKPSTALTPSELAIAEKMGLTPEAYARGKIKR
jgi:hypothetical protein